MGKSLAETVGRQVRRRITDAEVDLPLPERLMGIEIEAERRWSPTLHTSTLPIGWTVVGDGSLRDGVEYKLTEPLAGGKLAGAIESMFAMNEFGRSYTSSCHIHIDILEEEVTPETLQSLFLLLFMTEEVMYQVGDPGRKYCGFTHPLTYLSSQQIAALTLGPEAFRAEREAVMPMYSDLDEPDRHFNSVLRNGSRYVGLNVQAMYKYGSIEFRYFPTPISKDELYSWIRLCQSYMKAAMALNGLTGVKEMMASEETYLAFIGEYFSPWSELFIKHAPYDVAKLKLVHAQVQAECAFIRDDAVLELPDQREGVRRLLAARSDVVVVPEAQEVAPTNAGEAVVDMSPVTISRSQARSWWDVSAFADTSPSEPAPPTRNAIHRIINLD